MGYIEGDGGYLDSFKALKQQIAVLERMRSLSIFKEYKATVVETRKEVGLYTVLIIFGIILSILLIILSRSNI